MPLSSAPIVPTGIRASSAKISGSTATTRAATEPCSSSHNQVTIASRSGHLMAAGLPFFPSARLKRKRNQTTNPKVKIPRSFTSSPLPVANLFPLRKAKKRSMLSPGLVTRAPFISPRVRLGPKCKKMHTRRNGKTSLNTAPQNVET